MERIQMNMKIGKREISIKMKKDWFIKQQKVIKKSIECSSKYRLKISKNSYTAESKMNVNKNWVQIIANNFELLEKLYREY